MSSQLSMPVLMQSKKLPQKFLTDGLKKPMPPTLFYKLERKEFSNQKTSLPEQSIVSDTEKEKNGCLKNMPLMNGLMTISEKKKDSNNKWEDKVVLLPTLCPFAKSKKFSAALDLTQNYKAANSLNKIMFLQLIRTMKFN